MSGTGDKSKSVVAQARATLILSYNRSAKAVRGMVQLIYGLDCGRTFVVFARLEQNLRRKTSIVVKRNEIDLGVGS